MFGIHRRRNAAGSNLLRLTLVLAGTLTFPLACGREEVTSSSSIQLLGQKDLIALKGYTIKITAQTVFKKELGDSNDLPSGSKCNIKKGAHLTLRSKPSLVSNHWKVQIAGNPQGCSFSDGYVFSGHGMVPEMGEGEYRLPMPGSYVSSGWCKCRNVGSSPHIGLDLARGGGMTSVALSNGTVQSVSFNGSCGHEVRFKDAGGAVWLYRHLNRPEVYAGQRLSIGQRIGTHSSYPTSGCGTGPHLHFERLSAGSFRDSPQGRSCQYGYRTCNYNPNTPFSRILESKDLDTTAKHDIFLFEDEPKQAAACNPLQPVARHVSAEEISKQKGDTGLVVGSMSQIASESADGVVYASWHFALSQNGEPNRQNRCQGSLSDQICLASYQLFVETKDDGWIQLASSQMTRDNPIETPEESKFCLPERLTGRYHFVGRVENGLTVVNSGHMQRRM